MSWKRFREGFRAEAADESHFVLGIDLGSATSSIAYFDTNSGSAEIIDISGGYGKTSVPSALQYAAEGREWIFGEYAILNANGTDALLRRFMEKLGGRGYLDVGNRPMPVVEIVSVFLRELVNSTRAINPKARIAGIICAIPSYYPAEARADIEAIFRQSGLAASLIESVSDRECALAQYFGEILGGEIRDERVMMLDYGAREFRAQIFDISTEGGLQALCRASLFEADLGCDRLDWDVYQLFAEYYCEASEIGFDKLTTSAREQLFTFTHQHKDMLFAKSGGGVRLYFNFIYPPFAATATEEQIEDIIAPYRRGIDKFLADTRRRIDEAQGGAVAPDVILLTGGGFEMPWARRLISQLFPDSRIVSPKNPKGMLAQGAARIAAGRLGIVPDFNIEIVDYHKIPWDIGVMVKRGAAARFLPIIEGGSFWWQKHPSMHFILREEVLGGQPIEIEFHLRDDAGDTTPIQRISIPDLPPRPSGTTKLAINLNCTSQMDFVVNIADMGFGEMFPSTGLKKEFLVKMKTDE